MRGVLLREPKPDDMVAIYPSTVHRREPTYHEPGWRRPMEHRHPSPTTGWFAVTLCGLPDGAARTIQRRHAALFARPCQTCQAADPQGHLT
jgi:hypothetical protein